MWECESSHDGCYTKVMTELEGSAPSTRTSLKPLCGDMSSSACFTLYCQQKIEPGEYIYCYVCSHERNSQIEYINKRHIYIIFSCLTSPYLVHLLHFEGKQMPSNKYHATFEKVEYGSCLFPPSVASSAGLQMHHNLP